MKLLLDTQILLWAAGQPRSLSAPARQLLSDPRNDLLSSAASIWEVAIKSSLGRVDSRVLRRGLLDNGYAELAVSSAHAAGIDSLPPIHRDPFDRMLVSQATHEGITLLTADATVAKYPGPIKQV